MNWREQCCSASVEILVKHVEIDFSALSEGFPPLDASCFVFIIIQLIGFHWYSLICRCFSLLGSTSQMKKLDKPCAFYWQAGETKKSDRHSRQTRGMRADHRVSLLKQTNSFSSKAFFSSFRFHLGTLISAFAVFCCGKHDYEKNIDAFLYNLLAAVLQTATMFIIVGWIWSILWGFLFVQLSGKKVKRRHRNVIEQEVSLPNDRSIETCERLKEGEREKMPNRNEICQRCSFSLCLPPVNELYR